MGFPQKHDTKHTISLSDPSIHAYDKTEEGTTNLSPANGFGKSFRSGLIRSGLS
jgi:hypothetical protein